MRLVDWGIGQGPDGRRFDANEPKGSRLAAMRSRLPCRTIGRAMDMAKAAGKRVYVCAGSYPEQLVVGSSRDGVNVYGALDCATWSYGAATKSAWRLL